jgi:sensor histidine kinase regulating citrate/malate metabolism
VELGGNDQSLVMIGLSIICIIDVSTYYIYDKINEAYLQRLEREAIKQRVEMYEHQLDLMEQSHKNIKALRHDMKKHLYLIQSYLDDNETDKAQQYIDNINEHMVIPGQHIHTGNQEIDAIVNYMFDRAIRMGSKIETQIEVPNIAFMDKMDMNIILGNLLDNALEALGQTEERQISVNMKYKKGIFVVKISNSYDGTLIKRGEKYITRKQDTESHGLGLQNVSEIIEKYNGEKQIETTSNMFKISIILYVGAVQE